MRRQRDEFRLSLGQHRRVDLNLQFRERAQSIDLVERRFDLELTPFELSVTATLADFGHGTES